MIDKYLYERIYNCICPKNNLSGGNIQTENILDILEGGSLEDDLRSEIENLKKELEDKNRKIEVLEDEVGVDEVEPKKKPRTKKNSNKYTYLNLLKSFKTEDGKLFGHPNEKRRDESIDDSFYKYDPFEDAFTRNQRTGSVKYQAYQKKFIEEWSVSIQKLVILYYGAGSGKSLIALNCAEQFAELNKNAQVIFLLPSSLILNMILEFYKFGIDPRRKNDNGEYVYNFVSYQQMLNTVIQFREKCLLIIDEAHNLRNMYSSEIKIKESSRKYKGTGAFSIIGNKLSKLLQENADKFIRTLMMTGTLFVNSPDDLEPLISIGYNKTPLLDFYKDEYKEIMTDPDLFKHYYEGLISFYRIEPTNPKFPRVKYNFELIEVPNLQDELNELKSNRKGKAKDPYFVDSRTVGTKYKVDWTIKFLKKNSNQKTLIYSQFLKNSLDMLINELKNNNIKYGLITGKLDQTQKMNIVQKYNKGDLKVLLFTLSIKEGISFSETNNIILFQPYWNYSIIEQVIARGIRLTSHAKGQDSIVNVWNLIVANKKNDEWINKAENIMNNNIKKYVGKIVEDEEDANEELKKQDNSFVSRDVYLYNMMFKKQIKINKFEKRLLALPRFENVNNLENNDFIKYYNEQLLEFENVNGEPPSKEYQKKFKRKIYDEFYKKNIYIIQSRYAKYKYSAMPDIEKEAIIEPKTYKDMSKEIDDVINSNKYTLEALLKIFGIDKQTIVRMQAFFTPPSQVDELIKFSGIVEDSRQEIRILEPTAGVGNVVQKILGLNNRENFIIECNEYYNPFYQIGKALYKNISNVEWTNFDFYNEYVNKFNFDYILGNPPFNIKIKSTQLYDIDFVANAYNMLNENGILCMIISVRYQYDTAKKFEKFREYIDKLKELNAFDVRDISEFKKSKTTTKEMTTKTNMVSIRLKKIEGFVIDLED